MALFLIERNFAQALKPTAADIKAVGEVNAQAGVKWLYSFLSADKRKTYCLYRACRRARTRSVRGLTAVARQGRQRPGCGDNRAPAVASCESSYSPSGGMPTAASQAT